MTIITINERTAKGKYLIEFLRKFEGENYIKIGNEPNSKTMSVISEINHSKRHKSVDSLMKDLMVG